MHESLELLSQALLISALLSAIPLSVAFVVGLVTAVIQTLTQVQEQTVSFFPKIVGLSITLFIFGPWIINKISSFMAVVLGNISRM